MNLPTLDALFNDHIKDLYSAENQLIKALPKMAKRAALPALKQAFEDHLEETQVHVERLDTLASELELKLGGKKCKAMEGLIEEGKEFLEAEGEEAVIDAALISAAQKVEHYEISAYATALAMAERLGYQNAAALLQETLNEEDAADDKLSEISEASVLEAAAAVGEETDDE
jgi:ferritin-like metal-binding protein YciE